jgi:hypothetical protein
VSDAGRHWRFDVRPRAQRQLSRLPEKVAMAVAEFIVGPLLDNPTVSATLFTMNTLASIRHAAGGSGVFAT